MISEKDGTRKFEQVSRWNVLDYTFISRKSTFAKYADNPDSSDAKLCFTRFRYDNNWQPFNRFEKLTDSITLADRTVLSRKDTEGDLFLELNSDKSKVRVYREVHCDR